MTDTNLPTTYTPEEPEDETRNSRWVRLLWQGKSPFHSPMPHTCVHKEVKDTKLFLYIAQEKHAF